MVRNALKHEFDTFSLSYKTRISIMVGCGICQGLFRTIFFPKICKMITHFHLKSVFIKLGILFTVSDNFSSKKGTEKKRDVGISCVAESERWC